MHWHLLLHTRFICANCLAFEWGQLVGQEYAIVKVLPVAGRSYAVEVTKYAVKGSEIARWSGPTTLEFINAQKETRMFTVFGTFRRERALAKAAIELEKTPREPCECGCDRIFVGNSEAMVKRMFDAEYQT